MKKTILLSVFLLVFSCHNASALFRKISGLDDARIKRVVLSPLNPKVIYAASDNSLYLSKDKGDTFIKKYVFKDEDVQHMFFDRYSADILYLATTRHLYKITDNTKEKLFSASDDTIILTAAQHRGSLLLGTANGLIRTGLDILAWQSLKSLADVSVTAITGKENSLYLATAKGAYIMDENGSFKRMFIIRQDEEEETAGLRATAISADIFKPHRVWLGTSKGLFFLDENSGSFRKAQIEGMDNVTVNSIAQTELEANTLYAACEEGLFKVNTTNNTASHIFEGIESAEISWVEFSKSGEIYLATPRGLFENSYFNYNPESNLEDKLFMDEPSIEEVHKMALDYNQVSPDKIRAWRNGLKFRALLPDFNLDYDKTVTYDSGADRYYVGPRDWGISFKWNLGDILWNSYEDDIDTRARLNTQLRIDILEDINRIYFERLRVKQEIASLGSLEKDIFKRQLRLRELTAALDLYTGGRFSKKCKTSP
ncbi:MAG: hypothetical protein ABH872_02050 [Candidatus Omnitrophota bacterium]